jgi:2-amino-4-hydroxy-6-hydroxymethyldihydropteridine diphosphokinase
MTPLYLSLGSNLGDKAANLHRAVALLEERLQTPYTAISSIIETAPWGYESANSFLNTCVLFDLDRSATRPEARQILAICKEIENEMGRIQRLPGEGYKDRIIDIDILIFGKLRMRTKSLTIPHPLMRERDFVMIPLGEIYRR